MRPLPVLLVAVVLSLAAAAPDDPLVDQQWHLPHIGTFAAWEQGEGDGIVVAVVDTGVDGDHPDLEGQLVPGIDLIDRGTAPDDPNGHGTIVAGIIGAAAGNGVGGAGVAPGARIMPVRVLGEDGEGSSRTVADGIRWAADRGADVINLSLTDAPGQQQQMTSLVTTDVELAIREASLKGALVVVAAGNEGRTRTPYRSGLPVLVVGATDQADRVWAHSNRDDRTMFAPGIEIISTFRRSQYVKADGTSFAAPIVAAAAAILRAQGLDAGETRERLTRTAVDVGAGLGRIDLRAAVGVTGEPTPTPTEPPSPAPDPPPPAGRPVGPTVEPIEEPSPAPPAATPDSQDQEALPFAPDDPDDVQPVELDGPVVVLEPAPAPPAVVPEPGEGAQLGLLPLVAATLLALDLLGLAVALALRRAP